MPTYKYFSQFRLRYDLNLRQAASLAVRNDSIQDLHTEVCCARYNLLPIQRYCEATLFASSAYAGFSVSCGVFHCRGRQFYISPERLEAFSYRSGARFRYSNDFYIWQKNAIRERFHAIDLYPVPRQNRFRWKFDENVAVRHKFFVRLSSIGVDRRSKWASRFDRLQLKRVRQPSRWNVIPCEFRFKEFLRFDSWKKEFAQLPVQHQAFVKSGWRIIAKNIVSGEKYDLGFVEPKNPALEDVFLPDGDYEISVLTSSLFWQDCLDRNIRTISIRPGQEVSPLPVVYNLRSSVSQGVTTIRWSANRSEVEDCVFGVWYSSDSPVDVERPPDTTAWYLSSQNEYATTFQQTAPCYVAIAAMLTGNEPEIGKIHELFLDWSNVPPRSPDDVIVWDISAPSVTENSEENPAEPNENWSLWGSPNVDFSVNFHSGSTSVRNGFGDFSNISEKP